MTTLQAERVFIGALGDPIESFEAVGYTSEPLAFAESPEVDADAIMDAFNRIAEVMVPSVNPRTNYSPLVRNGINILNRIAPDWLSKIDLESLDVASEHGCVLGQVFGSYQKGCEVLTAHGVPYFPADYGFALAGIGSESQVLAAYARLTEEWKEVLIDSTEGASSAA